MAVICELKSCPEEDDLREEEEEVSWEDVVEVESSDSDDSNEDPTFDILEETRSKMSRLSVKKSNPRERSCEPIDMESEEEPTDVQIPELNEKDGKCFEVVEKLIKDGKLDKLKVDQCKVYLRKYGLRLSGNKGILIGRIKEHLEIIDGGEKKYPPTSFVLNCKGDACTGDVVMFEQNVYEMFSIVSRSATAPPCGTRVVVGRIVKESYGAAKQQHTFTIEVLWSKGEKPLPPLHPLLIKGRNLYRLKTMRQRWVDEEERRKILQEKHSRGFVARCSRENRIHGKEIKKMARNGRMKENNREQILSDQRNQYQMNQSNHRQQEKPVSDQRSQYQMNQSNHWQQQEKPVSDEMSHIQMNQSNHQQQQEKSVSDQRSQYQFRHQHHKQHQLELQHHLNPIQRDVLINRDINHIQLQRHPSILSENSLQMQQRHKLQVHNSIPQVEKPQLLAKPLYYQPPQARAIQSRPLSSLNSYRVLPQHHQQPMQRLPCRFYPKGKCYFGGKCKYLHESR